MQPRGSSWVWLSVPTAVLQKLPPISAPGRADARLGAWPKHQRAAERPHRHLATDLIDWSTRLARTGAITIGANGLFRGGTLAVLGV